MKYLSGTSESVIISTTFLNKFLLKFAQKNSDKINCQLWAGKQFSITKTQPESAISIGQFYWQGMHEICMKFEYQQFQ